MHQEEVAVQRQGISSKQGSFGVEVVWSKWQTATASGVADSKEPSQAAVLISGSQRRGEEGCYSWSE